MFNKRILPILGRLQQREGVILVIIAAAVGAGTGLAAVFFIRLIAFIQLTAYGQSEHFFPLLGPWSFILIPVLGSFIVGPIVAHWAVEAKGHGVPEVMQAMVLRGGRIRPRVVLAKIIASAVCIGTGGSAGREGPIIQVGSALGSSVGQVLGLSTERIKNLVACGAAAGIAATFNAPIAGVAFASEILMCEFQVTQFGNVLIASVAASVVSQMFLGAKPAFVIPSYAIHSYWEIGLYFVLGLLAAAVGVMFIVMLDAMEEFFQRWRLPQLLKPVVGALLLGTTGFLYFHAAGHLDFTADKYRLGMPLIENIPHVYGSGFTFIEKVLLGEKPFYLLALLIFLKPLATSLTLGSGNSGGVFAPSLFTGAVLGGAFGHFAGHFFPGIASSPGSYALVGMAAVFASAARAPFTSILIVFEMSNDYHLILPLMTAGMVASFFSQLFYPESIYTVKLAKKGIRFEQGRDTDVMQSILVEEVMNKTPVTVSKNQSVADLLAAFHTSGRNGLAVMDERGELYGMVTVNDIERRLPGKEGKSGETRVAAVATEQPITVFPDEQVWHAIRKMAARDLARLPVVDRNDEKKLVGVISRNDIMHAYDVAIVRKQHAQQARDRMAIRNVTEMEFMEICILPDNPCANKSLADIHLPHGANMISLERQDGTLYIPHGGTRLLPGDTVTVLARISRKQEVQRIFGIG